MAFDDMIPPQVIGALRVGAARTGAVVELQTAQVAKQFVSDQLIAECGWMKDLRNPHEKDAARHALYYLIKQNFTSAPTSKGEIEP